MAKKKVVVSFDYENDKLYYFLLEAWNENPNVDFEISNCTPSEIQTESVPVIKQVLSRKISEANYMIVIIGKHSNDKHPESEEIGFRNWQAYEIKKNIEIGNKLVVVKLNSSCEVLNECNSVGGKCVTGFSLNKIKAALNELGK